MTPFGGIYEGRRVMVTGHTGFKGAWMLAWLRELGADVVGLALAPGMEPNLFNLLGLEAEIDHLVVDVRDRDAVAEAIRQSRPDVVFHLAAQSLVRESFVAPRETFETNVMGTVNVLEALRSSGRSVAAVVVTSDKCYENQGWAYGYRENDRLGGSDPYSASKGATELVVASWQRSFFGLDSPIAIASARAGNVIGGGDWASDRIMTDAFRALIAGKPIRVRNPDSTRPWQHVLEPLSGYLRLGQALLAGEQGAASTWNFGPPPSSVRSVAALTDMVVEHWGSGTWDDASNVSAPHEAKLLALNWDKAYHGLSWHPVWNLATAVSETVSWYKRWSESADSVRPTTSLQIQRYVAAARKARVPWSGDVE